MAYPIIRAGQRITSALLTSMMPLEVYKTADTSRASTTTLVDDPDLQLQLEANATYYVWIYIHYNAFTTEQIKTQWTTPAGSSGLRTATGVASTVNSGNPDGSGRWGIHAFTTDVVYGTRNGVSQVLARETAQIVTTSAGTVALKWAQNVSGANATVVHSGSYMRAKRVA